MKKSQRQLFRCLDAAQGRIDCDVIFENVTFLDVFSHTFRQGDVSICGDTIVGMEPGLRAKRVINAQGKWLVPGFIDAHVHIESSLMIPSHFDQIILSKGTTSAICDPHELANVCGVPGIKYFLEASERAHSDLWIMLSSCVPSSALETNGGGVISANHLKPLKKHRRTLGLAEMMDIPGVLNKNKKVWDKLAEFSDSVVDGHCPLLRGKELSAYALAGITSCHESSLLPEAQEKLTKGMAVWIREGSVAKDLEALTPLLDLKSSTNVGFCTDDRNPLDILTEGHIDHLVRSSIERGVSPEVAYRVASWNVARHYGLHRGIHRTGAIAPGYQADLILLEDMNSCCIGRVMKSGVFVDDLSHTTSVKFPIKNTVRAHVPEVNDLEGPHGRVNVIGVTPGKIITKHLVMNHDAPQVSKLAVLERYGKGSRPALGYAHGFGELRGAIASSVGHDSHNLISVGGSSADLRLAFATLISSGGGFCVVSQGRVLEHLKLPLGGLMSSEPPASIQQSLARLKSSCRSIGCRAQEPFLQLAFLSLPVIPEIKLTDRGLVDVSKGEIISIRAN